MYLPSSTYRVQLNNTFSFSQLNDIIEYLCKLGVSTIYASPVTAAMRGSMHGYDVCNPDAINKEIGTEEELEELAKQLSEKDMGWLQDIVPNHAAFATGNDRIFDVMERGDQSPYYTYFDINWNHFDPVYKGKLMIPFIGKDLAEAIDEGEIQIQFDNGFRIVYFDAKYPVAAASLPFLFSFINDDAFSESTKQLLTHINDSKEAWEDEKKEWLHKIQLTANAIGEALKKMNQNKGLLRQFLNQQHYILTWYKVTDSEIDFRRFFTVNQLICLRMEDEAVFNDYHRFIFQLYKKKLIQGLRIDHIDGLYNPRQYAQRLRGLFGDDCYMIAEKILEYNEDFARDWNLQGTSGYEFLSFTNQLLTDKEGGEKLLSFYKELVPQTSPYDELVFNKKHDFLLAHMGGELENLLRMIGDLRLFLNKNVNTEKQKTALGILMASLPVYRIYPASYPLSREAIQIADKTFATAEAKAGDTKDELALLKSVFYADGSGAEDGNKLLFLKRLMQFTGPLAAKGVEDTTFYVYNPLISHNEVGDSPSQLGITAEEFHRKMKSRQQNNPYSLNATSTHDTKRGEDGRMRINALALMPDEWIKNVNNWRQINTPFVKTINNKPAPTTNDEYFIYQSLIGAFPEDGQVTDAFKERSSAFLQKALREAKVETTYDAPNGEYEEACHHFLASILGGTHSFLSGFLPFLEKVIDMATLYSLAQTVIKITAPGIPDIYQGCELWDISYVDPDNRRPVDFECRKKNLDEIIELEKEGAGAVLPFLRRHKKEGREKLYVTYKLLNLRRKCNDVFLEGDYLPLTTNQETVLAYARRKEGKWIVVVVPLKNDILNEDISVSLPPDAPTELINIFTSETIANRSSISLFQTLKTFPVAVLVAGVFEE